MRVLFSLGGVMSRPKIVFFDIDDTLYHKDAGVVPQSAQEALAALHAEGILTAIATGRTPGVFPAPVNELIRTLGMDVLVTMNGQYCLHRGEVLDAHPLPRADIERLIALCAEKDWAYMQMLDDAMVVSREDEVVRGALHDIGPYRVDAKAYLQAPVYQMNVYVDEAGERELHESGVLGDTYQTIRWHPHSVDFLPSAASKARGIATCCARLGIAREEVMAFGDGLNDVEMLEYAGLSVAMGNGRAQAKAVADYVTTNVGDDGVYRALVTLGVLST